MVGQEVGIYGVFIGINNEPCITWASSLDILNTLGHFKFVLLLFLHKTIPLTLQPMERQGKGYVEQTIPLLILKVSTYSKRVSWSL